MNNIEFNGIPVYFKEMNFPINPTIVRQCPLCGDGMINCSGYIIITNNLLFPNAMVHKICVMKNGRLEDCIKILHEMYILYSNNGWTKYLEKNI